MNTITLPLDVIFIADATGSMASFIKEAKGFLQKSMTVIENISDLLDINYSLIVYRDHPPEDRSFASKILANAIKKKELNKAMESSSFTASGGGDIPESGLDAINDITKLDLRENSLRYAFLVGDAPLHGTFYNGRAKTCACKCGLTSDKILTILEKHNITLYALNISDASETDISFNCITPNVIRTKGSEVQEIKNKLSHICENAVWSIEKVLPILKSDKYMPVVDIATSLNVPNVKVHESIEVLNTLGLTKTF